MKNKILAIICFLPMILMGLFVLLLLLISGYIIWFNRTKIFTHGLVEAILISMLILIFIFGGSYLGDKGIELWNRKEHSKYGI